MATRIFLGASVLIWFGYGLFCFFQPGSLEAAAGVTIGSATASTEIRAMYGGLQAAIGVLAGAALLRASLVRPALLCQAFLLSGLAVSRLLGAVIDGSFTAYTSGAIVFEIAAAGCAIALLRGAATAAPQPG